MQEGFFQKLKMIRAWVILDTDMTAAVESPSYTRLRIYDITTTVIICEISETNNEVPPPVSQPGKNRHGQRRISPSLCAFKSCGRNVGFKGIRLVKSTLHCNSVYIKPSWSHIYTHWCHDHHHHRTLPRARLDLRRATNSNVTPQYYYAHENYR